MNTYLTIMVTVLVATQVIRITQNAISLFYQNKKIEKTYAWIEENDISEKDFETQREVFRMLYDRLNKEEK